MGNPVAEGRRALIRNMWNERIKGAKRNVEVNTIGSLLVFGTSQEECFEEVDYPLRKELYEM